MWQTCQMLILAVVLLAPIFVFANELSGDEFVKSGVGLACGAVIVTALRMLEKKFGGPLKMEQRCQDVVDKMTDSWRPPSPK